MTRKRPFGSPRPQAALAVADLTRADISIGGDHVLGRATRSNLVVFGGRVVLQSTAEDCVNSVPLLISGLRQRQIVKGWSLGIADLAPEKPPVAVSRVVLLHQSLLLADVLRVEEAGRLLANDSDVVLRHG